MNEADISKCAINYSSHISKASLAAVQKLLCIMHLDGYALPWDANVIHFYTLSQCRSAEKHFQDRAIGDQRWPRTKKSGLSNELCFLIRR